MTQDKRQREDSCNAKLLVKPEFRVDTSSWNALKKAKSEAADPILSTEVIPSDTVIDSRDRNNIPIEKKQSGQNKSRHVRKSTDKINLCLSAALGEECKKSKCFQSHDAAAFLEVQEADLGPKCANFEIFGYCRFGLKCRYGLAHSIIDENGTITQVTVAGKEEYVKFNWMPQGFQKSLRQKTVICSKADAYIKEWSLVLKQEAEARIQEDAIRKQKKLLLAENTEIPTASITQTLETEESSLLAINSIDLPSSNPILVANALIEPKFDGIDKAAKIQEQVQVAEAIDHGPIKLRNCEKKKLDFRGKSYLAPLTTVGNMPFRRICKGYGVDITCGEMALTQSLLLGNPAEYSLLRRHKSEDFFGVQLAGTHPESFAKCCEIIEQNADFDFLDINLGCPIDLICNKGAGSALLERRSRLRGIVNGAVNVLDCPVTVKLRTGITDKKIAHHLIPLFQSWNVSACTLHGRSKQQRYTKLADWEYIKTCSELTDPSKMSFFGNGDVFNPEDMDKVYDSGNFAGAMIGRGALIKPWIFTELKTKQLWDISANERFDMLKKFSNFGLEHWGSDTQGVNQTRKFMCEWLSFLCRYVPVGIIETLPQQMNLRPERFVGRSDLETLMASPDSQDWVKISEMLLGPAPSSFSFIPKHKSNAYNATE